MIERVIRTGILFFDSNPAGRIVTRFTKDMLVMDYWYTAHILVVTYGLLRAISVVITISIVNPYLIIVAVIGVGYMYFVATTGLKPMIESQRFD